MTDKNKETPVHPLTSEAIGKVNEGTAVDADTLEEAVEKVQAAREESEEVEEVNEGDDAVYLRVLHLGQVMEACLKEASRITTVCKHPEKAGDGHTCCKAQFALAIFRKVTEGEERREFTALFERVADWWMKREEEAAKDLQASREQMEASRKRLMVSESPPDPMFRGLRNIVNYLLDVIQDAAKPKAAEAGSAIATAVREEIRKQTGQEDQNPIKIMGKE